MKQVAKKLCNKKTAFVPTMFLLSSVAFNADAQTEIKKNQLGIVTGGTWQNGLGIMPSLGIVYERKLTTHSSFETSLRWAYVNAGIKGSAYENEKQVYYSIKERYNYFSVPLLYKYTSKALNISAGPLLDICTGKPAESTYPFMRAQAPSFNKLYVDGMFKVGKAFEFKDRFVLEPEAAVSTREYFKKFAPEVNVTLKYKL